MKRRCLSYFLTVACVTMMGAHAEPAGAADHAWWFFFSQSNPTNSGFYREQNSSWVQYWRSGSGNGNTNPCTPNAGPLPMGEYSYPQNPMRFFTKTWGDAGVRGPVIELGSKRCNGPGTLIRSELFIHTKYPWPGTSGYYSNGCIKLSNMGGNPSNGAGTTGDIFDVTWFHAVRQSVGQRMSLYRY